MTMKRLESLRGRGRGESEADVLRDAGEFGGLVLRNSCADRCRKGP